MLTYTLTRREKALLLVLAIIVVFMAWFMLVFQRTNDQINAIENEIATVDANTTVATAQINRMHAMQAVIDKYKSEGMAATPVPTFDNMTPLMTELNAIMARTETYTLSFDDLDTTSSSEYVLRGVTADFNCDTFATAESVVSALAKGAYPCSVDSVVISDNSAGLLSRITGASGSSSVAVSVHVTFFEKPATQTGTSRSSSSNGSSSASVRSASSSSASSQNA